MGKEAFSDAETLWSEFVFYVFWKVRRVQSLVEMLDTLKARNSNPFSTKSNAVSVTTKWETFESGLGSLTAPPPMPSSTAVNQDWETFD
ncbi:BAG family molecular chaperone regulator 4 [Vitis vinifera]|uniref:BAG family molecular chaperone regulator 4 n=1 Tax=Vitis vinifera TaxID=29760 RepID=A0A438C9C2_VITVI|nr:BAG family molecular chaperone regulator 4 [Vitis vinifera]RVW19853.1 BAG family molecular chaperone regulator 4 [Vitis vinifera]